MPEPQSDYYLWLNGKPAGPFKPAAVWDMMKLGTITADTPFCFDGSEKWEALGDARAAEFAKRFAAKPEPPPPAPTAPQPKDAAPATPPAAAHKPIESTGHAVTAVFLVVIAAICAVFALLQYTQPAYDKAAEITRDADIAACWRDAIVCAILASLMAILDEIKRIRLNLERR